MKKEFNPTYRHSIFQKLIITYFITIIIPILILSALLIIITCKTDAKTTYKSYMSDIETATSNIELSAESLLSSTEILADQLKSHNYSQDEAIENYMNYNANYISATFIVSSDNNVEDSKYYIPYSTVNTELKQYLKLQNKNFYWIPSKYIFYNSDSACLSLIYPLNSTYSSCIISNVKIDAFFKYTDIFFDRSKIILVVFSEFCPKNATAKSDNVINYYDYPFSDKINTRKGSFSFSDKSYYFQYTDSLNASVVYHCSGSDPFKKLLPYFTLLIFIFTGAAILIVRTVFLLKNVQKRVKKITSAMREIENGNFDVAATTDYSDDEIAYLNNSFNRLKLRLSKLIEKIVETEKIQAHTQQIALQNQINPHFIYNTLEIFRMNAELAEIPETSEAIAAFGAMLRYNMSIGITKVTINDELKHAQDYICIINLKYSGNVSLKTECPEELKKIPIIKFILQPIIENSVKANYRILIKSELCISIKVEKIQNVIKIRISDNGIGMDKSKIANLIHQINNPTSNKKGIGLSNISRRLRLIYSEKGMLTISSIPDRETIVEITYPIEINEA